MGMFTVYAIRSEMTDRVYVGQTQDLALRLAQHNSGGVASTRTDRPWQVVKTAHFETRDQARWFEFQLKKSQGRRIQWLKQS